MKKIKLKKMKTKYYKIRFIVVLLILSIIFSFLFIHKKITPILMNYAESSAVNLATLLITQAVNDNVFEKMNMDELIINSTNGISVNPIFTNKLLNMITNYVQEYIEKVEKGDIDSLGVSNTIFSSIDVSKLKQGIICEIPSFSVFSNSLLSNLGPKIPVRINLIGDVESDLKTNITNYGINNAYLEVKVSVLVKMRVLLPFSSKKVEASTNIPIIMKIIEGDIPNFYYPSLSGSN